MIDVDCAGCGLAYEAEPEGGHRLACGDSTDAAVVAGILDGERPAVVFTDPPYGIAYQAMRGGAPIAGDATSIVAHQLVRDALTLVADAEAHFVCCDWRSLCTITAALVEAGVAPKACIVWDKEVRVQNLDRYAKQHEFIVYAGPYGGQPTMATDVWRHARDFDPDHPTPKPVALIAQALDTASTGDAVVFDPFGGSGSTLIACHQLGRRGRLVELDPRYVDVICARWQSVSGLLPVFEATGIAQDFS